MEKQTLLKNIMGNHTGATHVFHATVGQIGPKLGCLGLYIRSKQRSKSDLTFDNLLVFYIVNL